MRNISFALTTAQFRARSKSVTRRRGWWDAKVGDQLMAVEKSRGLPKGAKAVQLGLIELVDVRDEALIRLVLEPEYGAREVELEGFPGRDPADFVRWFAESHGAPLYRAGDLLSVYTNFMVRRLEFRYL